MLEEKDIIIFYEAIGNIISAEYDEQKALTF
jgi:hypothetical protein